MTVEEITDELHPIDRWLLSRYSRLVGDCTEEMNRFRFDRSVRETVYFMWHQMADHYLEITKNRIYSGNDRALLYTLYNVGLGVLKMMAPFLCHVTEELYQNYFRDSEGDKSIHLSAWPEPIRIDEDGERKGDIVVDVTAAVRAYKSESKMPLNTPLGEIMVTTSEPELITDSIEDMIAPMAAEGIRFIDREELEEVVTGVKPDFSKIGPRFKGDARFIFEAIKEADPLEAWMEVKGEGFTVHIPGSGDVMVGEKYLVFEKGMTMSGKRVESINIPKRDITIFVEKQ